MVFVFLTKISIDINYNVYFPRFQPILQGLLYTSYVLLHMPFENFLLMVDSPNGLAKYFLYVNYLVSITWVLILAL